MSARHFGENDEAYRSIPQIYETFKLLRRSWLNNQQNFSQILRTNEKPNGKNMHK